MDAKTAEALEKSIEHWRENCTAALGSVGISPDDCALCRAFRFYTKIMCAECPVFLRTHRDGCGNTPYHAASQAYARWWNRRTPDTEVAFRTAARAELAFLESLREPVKEL